MFNHRFIFEPGYWIGEGRVTFSGSTDHLNFYTRWTIKAAANGVIFAQQEVQMQGTSEGVMNTLLFSHLTNKDFLVDLRNELMGSTRGQGIVDAKTIAWEYRSHENFEGFEVYELQENGDYLIHAEYSSTDQFRTIIDGRIWKKENPLFPQE